MKESTLEKVCTKVAVKHGYLSYKFVSPGNAGVPDRIYIKDGRVTFIEFKAPGKKTRAIQDLQIKRLTEYGCAVYVIDDIDDFRAVLEICTC